MKTKKLNFIGLASVLLVIIAAFLPWAEVRVLFMKQTITGIDGDGKITLSLAVISGLALLIKNKWAIVPAILSTITAIYTFINLSEVSTQYTQTSIGLGIYLTIAGSLLLTLSCIPMFKKMQISENTEESKSE